METATTNRDGSLWTPKGVGQGYAKLLDNDWYKETNLELLRECPLEHGQVVVDLGCGPGTCTKILGRSLRSAGRVIAVDLAPEMIDLARQSISGLDLPVEFVIGSADQFSEVIKEKIDTAYLFNSIYHFADPQAVLEQIHGALNENGSVAICTGFVKESVPPNSRAEIIRLLRSLRNLSGESPHTRDRAIFSAGGLDYIKMCESAGFEVTCSWLSERKIPAENIIDFLSIPGFGGDILPALPGVSEEERVSLFRQAVSDSGISVFHRWWFYLVARKAG